MEYPFRTGFVFWEAQGLFCQFLGYIEKMIFKCCTLFRQRLLCNSLSHLSNANGRPKKATRRGCCSGRSALSSLPSICAAPPRQGRCPGSLQNSIIITFFFSAAKNPGKSNSHVSAEAARSWLCIFDHPDKRGSFPLPSFPDFRVKLIRKRSWASTGGFPFKIVMLLKGTSIGTFCDSL